MWSFTFFKIYVLGEGILSNYYSLLLDILVLKVKYKPAEPRMIT